MSPAATAQPCLCLQEASSSCLWTLIHLSEILPFHPHLPSQVSINGYTLLGPQLALGELPGPSGTSLLPCSTRHIPASAQGRLSPCPEGMPEEEFSATASGLAFCRTWGRSCSPGQLVEASVTAVTQSTKTVSAPGNNTALCMYSLSSDHTDKREESSCSRIKKTKVRAHRTALHKSLRSRGSPDTLLRARSGCQPLPALFQPHLTHHEAGIPPGSPLPPSPGRSR